MTRDDAQRIAAALRMITGRAANGLADRLVNAGGDAARAAVAAEAAPLLAEVGTEEYDGLAALAAGDNSLRDPKTGLLRGEIPFDHPAVRIRYAVVPSESGGAEIVLAASHREALRRNNPLLAYSGGETPDYDDASVFMRKSGSRFVRDTPHEAFLRKYGCITSSEFPAWDEDLGPVMALESPELMQSVLVYPILMAKESLPAESDPLPGWKSGEHYGRWTRRRDGHYLHVGLAGGMGKFKAVPEGGFRYNWTVTEAKGEYRLGDTVAGNRDADLPDAASAMRAAEAALDRHLGRSRHPVFQYGAPGVDIRNVTPSKPGVFWRRSDGDIYVMVDSPDRGQWMLGDRRVALLSIHTTGEIRWDVTPQWPGKGGEEAIEHFGLVPREEVTR